MDLEELPSVIVAPDVCPACGYKVNRRELLKGTSVDLFCENASCFGIKLVKMKNFIGSSKRGMGILGIGDNLIETLVDNRIVENPSDFYNLTIDNLATLSMGLGKVGLKRAETIVGNIQASKNNPVAQVISSLGIETLGLSRANLMTELADGKLDRLTDWVYNHDIIMSLSHKDLPPSHLNTIVQQASALSAEITILSSIGVGVVPASKPIKSELPFGALTFCFTGTRELSDIVEKLGGKLASGVSKNVQYLVQKDKDSVSSKSQKAVSLGIKVIGLDELQTMIEAVEK